MKISRSDILKAREGLLLAAETIEDTLKEQHELWGDNDNPEQAAFRNDAMEYRRIAGMIA